MVRFTLHTAALHGVSHQIAGPKTAPCRPGANEARLSNLVANPAEEQGAIWMCASAPFIKEDDLESVRGLLEELFPLLSKADAQWSQYRGTPRSSERGRVQCVAYWQGSLGRSSRPPRRRELSVLPGWITAHERSQDNQRPRPQRTNPGLVRSKPTAMFAQTFPR